MKNKGKLLSKLRPVLILFILIIQTCPLAATPITYSSAILAAKDENNPLINAIKANKPSKLKKLIQSGYDVNEIDRHGYTPLMFAVYKKSIKMVDMLIEAGAHLECYDNNGNSPFLYAFFDEEQEAMVAHLLALKVDFEVMNRFDQNPLILAALNNQCKSIQLLLDAGANIEINGSGASSPLMHAVDNERLEAAKLLIERGANIETRDAWSFTPLMLAALRNDALMIHALVSAGADANARTYKAIPVNMKKDWHDLCPTKNYIPNASTALDIAKQFQKRYAETSLYQEGIRR